MRANDSTIVIMENSSILQDVQLRLGVVISKINPRFHRLKSCEIWCQQGKFQTQGFSLRGRRSRGWIFHVYPTFLSTNRGRNLRLTQKISKLGVMMGRSAQLMVTSLIRAACCLCQENKAMRTPRSSSTSTTHPCSPSLIISTHQSHTMTNTWNNAKIV